MIPAWLIEPGTPVRGAPQAASSARICGLRRTLSSTLRPSSNETTPFTKALRCPRHERRSRRVAHPPRWFEGPPPAGSYRPRAGASLLRRAAASACRKCRNIQATIVPLTTTLTWRNDATADLLSSGPTVIDYFDSCCGLSGNLTNESLANFQARAAAVHEGAGDGDVCDPNRVPVLHVDESLLGFMRVWWRMERGFLDDSRAGCNGRTRSPGQHSERCQW